MTLCEGKMTVEKVSEILDLDRSTTQNYISGLRKTGLLKRQKDGRKYVYSMNSEILKQEATEKLEDWTEKKKRAIEEI